jgi:hypothetical protein
MSYSFSLSLNDSDLKKSDECFEEDAQTPTSKMSPGPLMQEAQASIRAQGLRSGPEFLKGNAQPNISKMIQDSPASPTDGRPLDLRKTAILRSVLMRNDEYPSSSHGLNFLSGGMSEHVVPESLSFPWTDSFGKSAINHVEGKVHDYCQRQAL